MSAAVPAFVLGGTGYVAGELLRLLAGHPRLRLAAVLSESQPGQPIDEAFPHLAGAFPGVAMSGPDELPGLLERHAEKPAAAAFCAAPHGAAAPQVDALLAAAERCGLRVRVVDLSADFRFPTAEAYAAVYGRPHGAPHRLEQFRCTLPEHTCAGQGPGAFNQIAGQGPGASDQIAEGPPEHHVGHPGCFPTAVLLAAVPLLRLGLIEPCLHVVAVTGSTGAGRTPSATTHHPARRSNLFAYNPLRHRHEPEMRRLAEAAAGGPIEIHFVPQAGPFARGIYATVQARLARPIAADEVSAALAGSYAGAPFVEVGAEPPRLQDVVGTNRCRIGVAASGRELVVFSAIDNLVKGAAGGAIQWMNRLLGLEETAGLLQPGLGWL